MNLYDVLIKRSAIDATGYPTSIFDRQQADKFIDLLVDQSVLMKVVRTERVNTDKGRISRLDIGQISSELAAAKTNNTIFGLDESFIDYDCIKYRTAFDLTRDMLQENLEGETAFRQLVINMFQKRIRTDMEYLAFNGDKSAYSAGDNATRESNLYAGNDGFRAILNREVPTANVLDAEGKNVSTKLFQYAKRKIPTRYQIAEPDYRWMLGSNTYDNWVFSYADRETVSGDATLQSGIAPGVGGIPVVKMPNMPENINYSGVPGFTGGGTNHTDIWLTPPSNLITFVRRDFSLETMVQPRKDSIEFTMHWKLDFAVENPDMVVLIRNIDPSSATAF